VTSGASCQQSVIFAPSCLSDFIPDGWTYSERYKFLLTEAVPVLIFICVGVAFYVMGRKTRERAAAVAAHRAAAGTEPLAD
jgi:hypothetical protein